MKAIIDTRMENLEELALVESVKQLRAYFKSPKKGVESYATACLSAKVIGRYAQVRSGEVSRIRATEKRGKKG